MSSAFPSDDEKTKTLSSLTCLECSVSIRPQDKFCSNCGTAIRKNVFPHREEQAKTVRPGAASLKEPVPGEIFANRFRVEKKLGAGGMGMVFLVEEKSSPLKLALKILRPEFLLDEGAKSRFEREIRILARVRHSSIPRIVEWGRSDDVLFFITEYIEGKNLAELLKEENVLAPNRSVPLVAAVAEALGSAHLAGVVHRDIKPSNIMVSKNGSVYLIDFGVARTVSAELTQLTATGYFIGTPEYMSPEQLDSRRADERSDISSLGVVLYELMTGKVPFSGQTPMVIATKHLRETPVSPRKISPDTPFWLERIVMRCLEKEPGNRYWTTNELLTDLSKSHSKAKVRRRVLPNGDAVVEDPSGRDGWVLSISSDREKVGWTSVMALYYRDSFFKLKSARSPSRQSSRWEYGFEHWPPNDIMRLVVDYEAEAAMQSAKASIFSKARDWLGGR